MYKQVDKFVCTFFWYAELTKIQKPSRPAKIYKPKQFISIALWFKIKPLHKYRKRFERDNSNNKLTRIFHSRKRVSVFAKKQPANTPFCLDLRAWMHTCGFHTWLKWKLQLFRLKCVSSLCSGHATVFQRWSAIRKLSHSSSAWWSFKSPCCHNFPHRHCTLTRFPKRSSIWKGWVSKALLCGVLRWSLQFCISLELHFAPEVQAKRCDCQLFLRTFERSSGKKMYLGKNSPAWNTDIVGYFPLLAMIIMIPVKSRRQVTILYPANYSQLEHWMQPSPSIFFAWSIYQSSDAEIFIIFNMP